MAKNSSSSTSLKYLILLLLDCNLCEAKTKTKPEQETEIEANLNLHFSSNFFVWKLAKFADVPLCSLFGIWVYVTLGCRYVVRNANIKYFISCLICIWWETRAHNFFVRMWDEFFCGKKWSNSICGNWHVRMQLAGNCWRIILISSIVSVNLDSVLWSRPIPLAWYMAPQWEQKHGKRWPRALCDNWIRADRFLR